MSTAGETPAAQLPPQPWMLEAPTRTVMAALAGGGRPARFVGGAVRDALLGRPVVDIDIATPEPPERVLALLAAAAITAVPTGLDHGTITAVAPPRHFEITTLRRDVETDGRHARVAFTDDWAQDAARRDFTMNALFLDLEGRIFDPVGGLADLRAGRVRFVGDARTRIREDVLRLLRFYRFHAHYGRGPADGAARAACRALAPLLPTLSAERVAAELRKLLGARDPLSSLRLMVEDGVLPVLLPESRRLDRLARLVALEEALSDLIAPEADPLRRLAALVELDGAGALALARRLRLSNRDRRHLAALAAPPWPVALDGPITAQRRALHHLGQALYRDLVLLGAAAEPADPAGLATALRPLLSLARDWQPAAFPLKGRDAARLGIRPGPTIGRLLAEVEAWWEDGDFRADRAACLERLAALARPELMAPRFRAEPEG